MFNDCLHYAIEYLRLLVLKVYFAIVTEYICLAALFITYMIIVFTEYLTNRQAYIFELVLGNILQQNYTVCTSYTDADNSALPCINYSTRTMSGAIQIVPAGLLTETGLQQQSPGCIIHRGVPGLFPTEAGDLPFDIFSAAFYMVSRYEEYLPHQQDMHGRFEATESLAYKKGFLNIPVVNNWAEQLQSLLLAHYPSYIPKPSKYRFVPTFDIDNAYAYRFKSIFRQAGATARQLATGNVKVIAERVQVWKGAKPDPYDTYALQTKIHQQYGLSPVYFWLLGNYAAYDKNIPYTNKGLRQLIRQLAVYKTGIHPSYASLGNLNQVIEEKSRLEQIIDKKVTCSRQHYIRLRFPETYRLLLEAGITEDYSMGFATQPGFRAGICTPFYFYDLSKEEVTPLKVVPFAFMDTNLKSICADEAQALALVDPIIKAVKEVAGMLCILFHNESLGGKGTWDGWKNFYEHIVRKAIDE